MDVQAWRAAGAAAVPVNCPAGLDRVRALAASLAGARTLVDLGCGRGRWLIEALLADAASRGTGVDLDAAALTDAARLAADAGVADRATWMRGDVGAWTGAADAVLCIGSTHGAGGIAALAERLRELPVGRAVLADGVWVAEPDGWCRDNLGEQPRVDDVVAELAAQGWDVGGVDLSTLDEWDAFEAGWTAGVRSVATPEAAAFAAEREAQYREHYRGVLGFAWFDLRQGSSRSNR